MPRGIGRTRPADYATRGCKRFDQVSSSPRTGCSERGSWKVEATGRQGRRPRRRGDRPAGPRHGRPGGARRALSRPPGAPAPRRGGLPGRGAPGPGAAAGRRRPRPRISEGRTIVP
ncbi:hypothetical protein EAH89_26985 [Roseomonas nepalensis]|uniref:Uncharacterized protein n=1 Tax=Muricoccus nepalensis TaxID=1854500 RepID=A0A502F3S5_9PROT|nr:hypothetical protein EAH89_26985 [Roseomonas nepalensis]